MMESNTENVQEKGFIIIINDCTLFKRQEMGNYRYSYLEFLQPTLTDYPINVLIE